MSFEAGKAGGWTRSWTGTNKTVSFRCSPGTPRSCGNWRCERQRRLARPVPPTGGESATRAGCPCTGGGCFDLSFQSAFAAVIVQGVRFSGVPCAVSVRILFSVGKAVAVGILFARIGFVEFQRAVAVRIFSRIWGIEYLRALRGETQVSIPRRTRKARRGTDLKKISTSKLVAAGQVDSGCLDGEDRYRPEIGSGGGN